MNGFFYRPERITTRWINRILWFYFIVFIFQQITHVWFNCGLLDALFCLQPSSCINLQIWRLFTYSFLHSDFWHIFFNLLLFYGSSRLLLQGELKLKQLLVLYSSGIVFGGLAWSLMHLQQPHYVLIGASAGVACLWTYFFLLYPEKTLSILLFFVFPVNLKARWCLTFFIGYELLNCLFFELQGMTLVAHSAHLGGALMGYLWFKYQNYAENHPKNKPQQTTQKSRYFVHIEQDNVIQDVPFGLLKKLQEEGIGALSAEERRWLENYRKLK